MSNSFLIIGYHLKSTFFILVHISKGELHKANALYIIVILKDCTRIFAAIVCYILSSSTICEKLIEIKKFVTDYVNCWDYFHSISKRNRFYLKRMKNQETVYISACGSIPVNWNLIFTFIGLMLIYGLFIINLDI